MAALPAAEIVAACERYGLPPDTWQRQERAFGLLAKVYAKRARIRGTSPPAARLVPVSLTSWSEPAGEAGEGEFVDRYRP